jgi:hypothetical protein
MGRHTEWLEEGDADRQLHTKAENHTRREADTNMQKVTREDLQVGISQKRGRDAESQIRIGR